MVAKKSKILYSVAKTAQGDLLNAKEADKGVEYFCPVCEGNHLILRKSGNRGRNSKRPHFAHKNLTTNCTPETALHYTFKTLVYEKIKSLLAADEPFSFSWKCQYCTEIHDGDSKMKTTVVIQKSLRNS